MNILGVGSAEFILILLMMLIFAGPKRMAVWAYQMGFYVAKFRQLWAETKPIIEAELKQAGLEVTLPDTPPTSASMRKQIASTTTKIVQPVQEALEEVNADLDKEIGELRKDVDDNPKPKTGSPVQSTSSSNGKPATDENATGFGTWSSQQ